MCVDASFEAVCGGFDAVGVEYAVGWVEVDKQEFVSPEVVEAVVCLADVGVCPGFCPGVGCGVFGEGFFVHPVPIDGGEVVELCAPL